MAASLVDPWPQNAVHSATVTATTADYTDLTITSVAKTVDPTPPSEPVLLDSAAATPGSSPNLLCSSSSSSASCRMATQPASASGINRIHSADHEPETDVHDNTGSPTAAPLDASAASVSAPAPTSAIVSAIPSVALRASNSSLPSLVAPLHSSTNTALLDASPFAEPAARSVERDFLFCRKGDMDPSFP